MRRTMALGLVTALAAATAALPLTAAQAAPTATGSSALNALLQRQSAAYEPPPISWKGCGSAAWDELGFQCGTLVVPMNYANPKGTKIKLAVSRIKHTTAKSQGVMLSNPGGPGASGLTLPLLRDYVPNEAGYAYDWIGFDPRGVGSSSPALSCDGDYFAPGRPKYVPTDEKIEKAWLARAKGYAADCAKAGGNLLNYLKTTDTVQDLESLRKALGQKQINYYGFSYGTYIGAVYSTLFPKQVRRVVFDGIVDPTRVWYKSNLDQDVAFDKAITVFFEWVAQNDATYHLGTTGAAVEKKYYDTLKALYKKRKLNNKLGGSEWNDVFLSAGYSVFSWEGVAKIFSEAVNDGQWQSVLDAYTDANPTGKGADNLYAIYVGTLCTEGKWTKNWSVWETDNWRIHQQAPFQTWGNAWFNAPCLYWAKRSSTPVAVDGSAAPPFLLINETLDGATPYSGALKVRKLFPKASLIEGVGGTTHSGSLYGVACTDDAIAAYLADGTLPARVAGNTSDKQCDPVPQPDPTAGDAGALSAKAASGPADRRALVEKLFPRDSLTQEFAAR